MKIKTSELRTDGGIPIAEMLDEKSCFSCSLKEVCRIRYDFYEQVKKHENSIDVEIDLSTVLGKNCKFYNPLF